MSEPTNHTRYVTPEGQEVLLTTPHGLIPPAIIDLHKPEVGLVRFIYAGPTSPAPTPNADETGASA